MAKGENKDALSLIHPELFEAVALQQKEKINQLRKTIEKLQKRDIIGIISKFLKPKKN